MKTIKRMPVNIKVSGLSNMNKYFNQMQFNGIKEDDNIYAIDQMSLRDAKNVYIDDNLRLVSRPTLQYSDLPPEIPAFSELVDIKDFGSGKVYITKSVLNKYSVIIVPNTSVTPIAGATFIIEELTNYHIATIEHYVICFNDVNAKIFDTNNADQGWQNLTNYAEVPVVKRVVGETITTYDKNYFIPDLYKEEYIWSNESKPRLPNTQPNSTIMNTNLGNFELSAPNGIKNDAIDYQIVRPVNYKGERPVAHSEPIPTPHGFKFQSTNFDRVIAANNLVGIIFPKYIEISYNKGLSFDRIYYPSFTGNLSLADFSKDGNFLFLVTGDGVLRYNLADKTWSPIFEYGDGAKNGFGVMGHCFLTGDIFSFVISYRSNIKLYFKGNGLYSGTECANDHMDPSYSDYYSLLYITDIRRPSSMSLNTMYHDVGVVATSPEWAKHNHKKYIMDITTTIDTNGRKVCGIVFGIERAVPDPSSRALRIITICGGNTSAQTGSTYMFSQYNDITDSTYGLSVTGLYINSTVFNITSTAITATIDCITGKYTTDESPDTDDIGWYVSNIDISSTNSSAVHYTIGDYIMLIGSNSTLLYNCLQIPKKLENNYYLIDYRIDRGQGSYKQTIIFNPAILPFSIYYNTNTFIPNTKYIRIDAVTVDGQYAAVSENNFYVYASDEAYTTYGYSLWTNALQDTDSTSITYTIGSAGSVTQVPTVSYSDTELYLAFDNLLQITYNTKDPDDPTKTLFNLPKINNQSFIDKITAIINISTTEIAIFFLNKIIICSKVADENLVQGFRYDYYNTKLSTGVRLGDSVINTLEGSFTLFPTLRGLAAMNYQAFMATNDQTISYITDTVKNMWTKFYNDSEQIRIIQWRNRLVLTNGTGTILLYDLITQAWWRWELSRDVLVALSNQLDLQVINGTLLTFKENVDQYYDFGERGEFSEINWYIMSQPLHFNAPNYYKNIKQLVFQMSETEDEKSTKIMDAQIKLYRKKITIREPETIKFKIEELRTFVKRFNYWKINELQWGISNDTETSTPKRLELNGISVKYEIGEEVK